MSLHHSFDIDLASQYGVECAILIHHFQHWIKINRRLNKNIKEGRCWTYQTRKEIQAQFPYLNYEEIKYLTEKLVKTGVLLTGNFNKNKIDRTLWYAFVDEKRFGVDEESSNKVYERENSPSIEKNPYRKGKIPQPIPDTKTNTKTQIYEESAEPPPLIAPKLKKELPEEAKNLSKKLYEKILNIHPNFKTPNFEKWAKDMEMLNRIDKRTWKEIDEMIEWAFDHHFWFKVIQSPDGLRNNWDKMQIQQSSSDNKGTIERKNRETANEVKNHLKKTSRDHLLWIGKDYVRNSQSGDSINFDLHCQQFEQILCKWFNLKVNTGSS